jgi:hypothetical protein
MANLVLQGGAESLSEYEVTSIYRGQGGLGKGGRQAGGRMLETGGFEACGRWLSIACRGSFAWGLEFCGRGRGPNFLLQYS